MARGGERDAFQAGWSGEASLSVGLSTQKLPFRLGRYLVLERLGQGGMGQVYLARIDAAAGLSRLCVLKTLRQDVADEEYRRRFHDEARLVVRLSHPNICPVFEAGEIGQRRFLAMDFVPGVDVRQLGVLLERQGRKLPVALALYVVGHVLDALDYAHRRTDPATGRPLQIVHRDVSPANVLVGFDGEVFLIDFGLATSVLKLERTLPHVVMGKLAYMSPEQARGGQVDARTDVFAAGVLLYELLTGERYYGSKSTAEISSIAGFGGYQPAGLARVDDELAGMIARATAADAGDRYATAGAFHDSLAGFQLERGAFAGPAEMGQLLEELLGSVIATRRARLDSYRSFDRQRAPTLKTEVTVTVFADRLATEDDSSRDDGSSEDATRTTLLRGGPGSSTSPGREPSTSEDAALLSSSDETLARRPASARLHEEATLIVAEPETRPVPGPSGPPRSGPTTVTPLPPPATAGPWKVVAAAALVGLLFLGGGVAWLKAERADGPDVVDAAGRGAARPSAPTAAAPVDAIGQTTRGATRTASPPMSTRSAEDAGGPAPATDVGGARAEPTGSPAPPGVAPASSAPPPSSTPAPSARSPATPEPSNDVTEGTARHPPPDRRARRPRRRKPIEPLPDTPFQQLELLKRRCPELGCTRRAVSDYPKAFSDDAVHERLRKDLPACLTRCLRSSSSP